MAMLVKIRGDILITSIPDLELFLRLFYSQGKIAKLLANVILLFRQMNSVLLCWRSNSKGSNGNRALDRDACNTKSRRSESRADRGENMPLYILMVTITSPLKHHKYSLGSTTSHKHNTDILSPYKVVAVNLLAKTTRLSSKCRHIKQMSFCLIWEISTFTPFQLCLGIQPHPTRYVDYFMCLLTAPEKPVGLSVFCGKEWPAAAAAAAVNMVHTAWKTTPGTVNSWEQLQHSNSWLWWY